MRRKYGDCQRADGDCTACSLVHLGVDCKGKSITNLEWQRRMSRLSIKELAERSGVNVRLIQNVELGSSDAGNMTARNLLAIADALGVDARDLIDSKKDAGTGTKGE